MPSNGVNADPSDVRKLASALTNYQSEVSQAGKRVQGALTSAMWHDRQKAQFEERFRDLQKSIERFMIADVDSMIKSLTQLAGRIEEIQRMRL